MSLTAIMNTTALANPATVRNNSHPIMLGSSGIAARVITSTASAARHDGRSGQPRGGRACQRAREVSDVVRGRHCSRSLRSEGDLCGHQRQDRGVGEASDAPGGT